MRLRRQFFVLQAIFLKSSLKRGENGAEGAVLEFFSIFVPDFADNFHCHSQTVFYLLTWGLQLLPESICLLLDADTDLELGLCS